MAPTLSFAVLFSHFCTATYTPCRKTALSTDLRPQLLLTKGDNNELDDVQLYNGVSFLERKNIIGKVRGYVHPLSPTCIHLPKSADFAPSVTSESHET